jgi:thioesterase domain-containing protein
VRGEAMSGFPPRERTLSELAAGYCERIRALYPHGPYRFYGASLGGVLALEIARQLLAAGEEVPLVVLGDSFAPTSLWRRVPSSAERAAARVAELRSLSLAERLRRVAWLVARQLRHRSRLLRGEGRASKRALVREQQAIERAVASGEPVPPAVRGRYGLNEYAKLLRDHEPRPPYPDRVLLLSAFEAGGAPDRGWRELLGERLTIADVPGTHEDLGREASGVYVGPIIARLLGVHTDRDAAGEGALSASGTSR